MSSSSSFANKSGGDQSFQQLDLSGKLIIKVFAIVLLPIDAENQNRRRLSTMRLALCDSRLVYWINFWVKLEFSTFANFLRSNWATMCDEFQFTTRRSPTTSWSLWCSGSSVASLPHLTTLPSNIKTKVSVVPCRVNNRVNFSRTPLIWLGRWVRIE